MSETLDMGKYADRDFSSMTFEVIPEGTYKVVINKYEKCVAKTGMEQMRIYATITQENSEHDGKPLADHIALSDAAEWRMVWFLKEALGWHKEDLKAVGKIARGSERFNRMFDLAKGRTMFWTITVDPAYGNNKVKEYIADEDNESIDVDELDGDIPDFLRKKE
jgi:hypothetical protein